MLIGRFHSLKGLSFDLPVCRNNDKSSGFNPWFDIYVRNDSSLLLGNGRPAEGIGRALEKGLVEGSIPGQTSCSLRLYEHVLNCFKYYYY